MPLQTIDRFLLGDNPFIGVSHLSQERARERAALLNQERILTVMDAAFQSGAQGITFSTNDITYKALKALKERKYDHAFGLYPLVPDILEYNRIASEKGFLGLATEVLGRLSISSRIKTILGSGLSLATFDPVRVLEIYLELEITTFLSASPTNATLKAIFLHEIISDLMLSLKLRDLAKTYVDYVNDKFGVRAGFVTRNFARFAGFLNEAEIELEKVVVLTPFNKAGYQMNPSQAKCEEALSKIDGAKILAMSPLASGYLNLEDAIYYLKNLRLDGVTIGVSTPDHARESFSFLKRTF